MIINDFDTSTLTECYVTDFGDAEGAVERTESVVIYGSNGTLVVPEGAFAGYNRTFTFIMKHLSDAMRLINAFETSNNIIEMGYLMGSVFYCDLVSNKYQPIGQRWKVEIEVFMQPFRYQKDVENVILTTSGTIENQGTVYSEPIIVIEGAGLVTLTIGKQLMELEIDTKATIDCRHKQQNVYDKNGEIKNTIRKRGPFFEIPVGRSGVATSGTVTKITIKGNWRYKV
ncbi:phage tail protein [Streptococcus suis]|nr:phage tail protein [Streptococcus suis]NQN95513.1 phage tail protein [Streptococcus suis]NQO34590.1 phage tail protein [Streptococcus suis]NQO44687.1 phage tail protein [Streptococcus suis]NQO55345.1 phage tail protein [Streptococcus suis]